MPAKKPSNSRPPRKSKRTPATDTPLQQRLMDALDGRILTKQQLADELLNGHPKALYRPGGITDLMSRGQVQNERGEGYFRRDALPIELRVRSKKKLPRNLRIAQLRILNELDGYVLTKRLLAERLKGGENNGSHLYRNRDMQGLMDLGLVLNRRGWGYFRPDALPADRYFLSHGCPRESYESVLRHGRRA